MTEQPKTGIKPKLVNFFGALGYIFCSLQWIWVTLLYFSFLNAAVLFISPNANKPIPTPPPTTPIVANTSPLFFILASIIVTSMLALTFYFMYKIPSTLVKTSKKVVNVATTNVTHTVLQIQHKKETKKARQRIGPKIIIFLKLILIITPIILAVTTQFIDKKIIDTYIAVYISVWLAAFSLSMFAIQYVVARIFSIKLQDTN